MPVYNSSEYLKESIDSVINQNYKNWELICVDDGSTDNSVEIIKSYENNKIKLYSQENQGPAQARKLGISMSGGKYICLLDSDDTYSNDYLDETLKQALSTNADVTMPILISSWKSEKECNFNDKHKLKCGEIISPREAFLRTFPWSVHGLNLYKASHMKKYALTDISNVNNFNADEYLTRYLLLFSNKVVISKGKYYYRSNNKSITQKFSLRQFSAFKVDKLLFELAVHNDFNKKELSLIANQLLINKAYLKYSYLSNLYKINDEDRSWIIDQINSDDLWIPHINIKNYKMLKFYIFLKTNEKLLYPVLNLRRFLRR